MECDPTPEAASASGDKQRMFQRLIERYYSQLTEGCGRQSCDNPACASSSLGKLAPNEAASSRVGGRHVAPGTATALFRRRAVAAAKGAVEA